MSTTAVINIDVLKRKVSRLVTAAISEAWKGAGHPEDIADTEAELKKARESLNRYLQACTVPKVGHPV